MSLTFADCLGLCDLTEQEVLAIAEHEHVPAIAALEMGDYLVRTSEGERRVKSMMRDYVLKHPLIHTQGRNSQIG